MEAGSPATTRVNTYGDLVVPMEVRVGSCTMTLKELCTMRPGSVVELDKPVGETLDLFVGNVRLASGEVVILEDRMAIRITEFDLRQPGQPTKKTTGGEFMHELE